MPPRLNIPPVTRILLIVLTAQSLLSAAIRYGQWTEESDIVVPYLTLVPQLSLLYPWVFVTSTLVENNVFTGALTGLALWHGGRYLERAWSSAELAKYLLIVSALSNLMCFSLLVLLYYITGNMQWSLTVIAGGISIQMAFLVAFSQLTPAHTVTLFKGIISMRVPRFPLTYLTLIAALTFTPIFTSASFLLALFGFLTSWTYLRFFKAAFPDLDSSQPSTLRGDASETFAFAEFFPGPLKAPVAALATTVFDTLVALRICTPFSAADVSAARGDASLHRGNNLISTRAETERRRALALKALDQRLHAATASASKPQPPPAPLQTQSQPTTQTAMMSEPGKVLGETNYNPEEGEGDSSNQ